MATQERPTVKPVQAERLKATALDIIASQRCIKRDLFTESMKPRVRADVVKYRYSPEPKIF